MQARHISLWHVAGGSTIVKVGGSPPGQSGVCIMCII